ncbi:erythromycin esterase family protein [Paucibacter sp. APW11]|uniref:Erythromycin esterase family protein n=1 Tax=Roseateles aquae TaxID=3077235 RepID=A0ABU3P8H4_9BURK|nr:erythromycin esterase family protein [Paucibacter sp. APW11]MDT8998869.1 erythromycin esterase family protein [Paucibacter sp. APW11]
MKLLTCLTTLTLACNSAVAAETPIAPIAPTATTWQSWPLADADQLDDFSDLAPLGQALAGVQVLGLGEQTHGAHEEFAYKLRLLRYLHEKLGFDLLLLESGFYDIGRISAAMARGESLDDLAPGNVFFMYAKSAEGRDLLRYVDQRQRADRPLLLAGFDAQHSGALSGSELLPGLQAALLSLGHKTLAEGERWRRFSTLAAPLLAMNRALPSAPEQQAFFSHGQAIGAALCGASSGAAVDTPAWWCRVVDSLLAQAHSFWSQDQDYQRDNAMGANAIWLVEQLAKGRKAVIWAHTVHLARGFQRTPQHLQAGEVMHRRWGPRYQVLQFTAAAGQILDFRSMQPLTLPPVPAGGLEQQLIPQAKGRPLLVHASSAVNLPQFAYEYVERGTESFQQPGQLGRNWDWLIFLPRVSPVTMVR